MFLQDLSILAEALQKGGMGEETVQDQGLVKAIATELVKITVNKDTTLFNEGEDAHLFYLVHSGKLVSSVGGTKGKEYGQGEAVGVDALFVKGRREMTMEVQEDAALWAINRVTYQSALMKYHKKKAASEAKEGKRAGDDVLFEWMKAMTEEQQQAALDMGQVHTYADGDVISKQGSKEELFYMIEEGIVYVVDEWNKKRLPSLNRGDFFGEETLLSKRGAFATTVAAATPTVCRVFTRALFDKYLGVVHALFLDMFKLKALRSVQAIASELSEEDMEILADRMLYQEFAEGTEIIKQGDEVDSFFIVFEGEVRSEVKGGNDDMAILVSGDHFGAEGLLTGKPVETTYTATNAVKCLTMTKKTFEDVMGPVQEVLNRQMGQRRAMWAREKDSAKNLKMSDLKMLRILGQGTFGRVALVRHPITGTMYALKRIVKSMVCDAEIGMYVENERDTMMDLDNQFVARLITTFQDKLSIYFLQELCENGELTQVLGNGALSTEVAQFYAANIVLGLKYLHERQVMFRDLKPENILIDKDGYLKLIDFGMCKKMSLTSRTFTMCGTPEYCAPEIIYMLDSGYRQGYGFGIDTWSLGVIICIMATGMSPVKGDVFRPDNMLSISAACRKMRSFPLNYPRNVERLCKDFPEVIKLVLHLLHPNADVRPGCNKNFFGSVKNSRFFKGVNWGNLSSKVVPAPPVRPCVCVCVKLAMVMVKMVMVALGWWWWLWWLSLLFPRFKSPLMLLSSSPTGSLTRSRSRPLLCRSCYNPISRVCFPRRISHFSASRQKEGFCRSRDIYRVSQLSRPRKGAGAAPRRVLVPQVLSVVWARQAIVRSNIAVTVTKTRLVFLSIN